MPFVFLFEAFSGVLLNAIASLAIELIRLPVTLFENFIDSIFLQQVFGGG